MVAQSNNHGPPARDSSSQQAVNGVMWAMKTGGGEGNTDPKSALRSPQVVFFAN
jgi:hypothetical protein